MGFKRIITFSDNRFHTGNLYEKLGFDFEEEIKPNFSYTNGSRRVSKYAMRVKAGINEKSAAEAKGWYRIWIVVRGGIPSTFKTGQFQYLSRGRLHAKKLSS